MTVVERNGSRDQFPVGMRVLAVDDDPTCLKVLETLLLRCQYHVTTTNQAIKALKMLRENKDQFDLVISDVHMPDMDGFKLLELVGLEMDLPVIMLSANGETQAVMKGITHGACDYLIKPVRIEELKNIWQHVIRRKRFDPRDNVDGRDDCEKGQIANSDGAQGSPGNESSDRNLKLNRKRKDQNEEDEEDGDDNLNDTEDSSSQKKPRVVWSVELHRKFVAAVNQLGIDKAVPKRILDLMNVERLTRENVASHLQKYRLYLKRLSAVANQQANMVAALRGRDPSSYLPMGSLDSYSNFNSLVGSRPLSARAPFQSNGALPRMNTFTGFGLHGFVPSGSTQLSRTLNNTGNPVNDVGKLQGIGLPTLQGNQQGTSLIQGMPTNLELDKLQQPKAMQEASNRLLNGFSVNSFTNATKSPHIVQMHQQQTQSAGLSNQSSLKIPSLSPDHFEIGIGDSSHAADLSRCTESWPCAIPSTTYPATTLPMSLPFSHNGLSSSNIGENISPIQNDALANVQNRNANMLNFGSLSNPQNSSLVYNSSSNSSVPINGISNKTMDLPITGQPNFGGSYFTQQSRTGSSSEDLKMPGGYGSGGSGLDDIVGNAIIKPECDDLSFLDGDIGCNDMFHLGSCI